MPVVSIVIPIYNVAEYLSTCLQSVTQQTYKDIQVILVDDGSTDQSSSICDQFAGRMSTQVDVIVIHQRNSGLSAARNRGLERATGRFILFLDSDDYVHQTLVADCVAELTAHSYDIVFFNYDRIAAGRHRTNNRFPHYRSGNSSQVLQSIFSHHLDNFAWSFMALRDLYDGIRFPLARNYEDRATTYRLVGRAKAIGFISRSLYYYRVRQDSITKNFADGDAKSEVTTYHEQYSWIVDRYPALANAQQRYFVQELMNDFGDTVRPISFKANITSRYILKHLIHDIVSDTGIRGYPGSFFVKYWLMRLGILHTLQYLKSYFFYFKGLRRVIN
ncbi:MAG: glycosyltransferase family 2 protein [Pseudoclavibacter sp.]